MVSRRNKNSFICRSSQFFFYIYHSKADCRRCIASNRLSNNMSCFGTGFFKFCLYMVDIIFICNIYFIKYIIIIFCKYFISIRKSLFISKLLSIIYNNTVKSYFI